MQYVYDNIRELRDKRKISQKVICDYLAMQQAGYSNLESGNTQLTIERLKQISDFFQVPITYFIHEKVKELVDELQERNQDLKALFASNSFKVDLPDDKQQAIEFHQKLDRKNETIIAELKDKSNTNRLLIQYLANDLTKAKDIINTLIQTPNIKKQIEPKLLKELKAFIKSTNTEPINPTLAFPLL